MSSTSSSSYPSSSTIPQESRAEAGPLPSKRGEIGFREDLHKEAEDDRRMSSQSTLQALPARHPADRETPVSSPNTITPNPTITVPSTPSIPNDASSTNSMVKRKGILGFLTRKKVPSYGGLLLTTLLAFIAQFLLVAGTIAGWVLSIRHINGGKSSSNSQQLQGASSSIFIHVVFGVTVLGQLLFLERRFFRLRAERYGFLHPGEMLPSSRRMGSPNPAIAFSPWNRPPLPSYAAALAQSGVGTGDVEDHLIAAPPPPAYGNTRGSTLLLAGFLRESLRAQRPVSARTQMSQRNDRPLSYVSRDEEWEEIRDADRARQLEETLSRLERPASTLSQHSRR